MANNLSLEKKVAAISMLVEGSSIRSVERVTQIHRDTIMRLGVRVGQGCAKLLDQKMRGLICRNIQLDEWWTFIGAKQKTVSMKGLGPDLGDIWVWVSLDSATKLVPAFRVGDRDLANAVLFLEDLASRLQSRPQISADTLTAYKTAVETAFGSDVDFGEVVKTFSHSELEESRRYSPADCLRVTKNAVQGNPDMSLVSTSFVEKQNHTARMHCRRAARLTKAFSKTRQNFEAAVALHYAYYNLCKRHQTIRCTPAQEAGVEASQWTVSDLVERTDPAD